LTYTGNNRRHPAALALDKQTKDNAMPSG